jgi:hypothetical protein
MLNFAGHYLNFGRSPQRSLANLPEALKLPIFRFFRLGLPLLPQLPINRLLSEQRRLAAAPGGRAAKRIVRIVELQRGPEGLRLNAIALAADNHAILP